MKRLLPWAGSMLVLFIICMTIYGAAQQSLRLSANDPQIQLATDAATSLDDGKTPASVVQGATNIAKSLSPFTIVYDKQGKVVIANGYLDGNVPVMPKGVLTAAAGKTYNAVTWEPRANVRIASVSVSAASYYVVSGRNMREIENRENEIAKVVGAGWLASSAIVTLCMLIRPVARIKKAKKTKTVSAA